MQSPSRTLQTQGNHVLLPLSQAFNFTNASMLQHSLDHSFAALNRQPRPHSILPLFNGGDFDAEYNNKYKPVEFKTPPGVQKAVLEAVVTGMPHMGLQQALVIPGHVQL